MRSDKSSNKCPDSINLDGNVLNDRVDITNAFRRHKLLKNPVEPAVGGRGI
jgi:hypothetical protein